MTTASASALVALYERPGPYATVFADVSLDREGGRVALAASAQSIARDLRDQGAPENVWEAVRETIENPVHEAAPQSRFVVAGRSGVMLDEVIAVPTPTPVVEWELLPDPGPWLLHHSATVPFVLVSVDHEGGDVSTFTSQGMRLTPNEVETTGHETEYVHKVAAGGWSHLRWHRSTEKVWREHAREVAERARRHVAHGFRLVIVAGSVESRREVVQQLADGPATIVELDRAGRAADSGDDALDEDVRQAVLDHLRQRRAALDAEIAERLGRRDRVASGIGPVLDAIVEGRLETLALDPVALRDEHVDPRAHPGLDLGTDRLVRSDLALLAGALRTDAQVALADRHEMGGSSVVGLLRW